VGRRIFVLRTHPAVDQGTGTPRATQMFHPFFVSLPVLPPCQLDQRLIVTGADALEALRPRKPPELIMVLLVSAYITLKTFAARHSGLSCR
jgi:hypothetical protein